jgi:hypothetical protein
VQRLKEEWAPPGSLEAEAIALARAMTPYQLPAGARPRLAAALLRRPIDRRPRWLRAALAVTLASALLALALRFA